MHKTIRLNSTARPGQPKTEQSTEQPGEPGAGGWRGRTSVTQCEAMKPAAPVTAMVPPSGMGAMVLVEGEG